MVTYFYKSIGYKKVNSYFGFKNHTIKQHGRCWKSNQKRLLCSLRVRKKYWFVFSEKSSSTDVINLRMNKIKATKTGKAKQKEQENLTIW